jgi:hypothetical protein
MVFAFIILWTPLHMLNAYIFIIDSTITESKHFLYLYFTCHVLTVSHSIFNPFIYSYNHQDIRNGFVFYLKLNCFNDSYANILANNDLVMMAVRKTASTPANFSNRRSKQRLNSTAL